MSADASRSFGVALAGLLFAALLLAVLGAMPWTNTIHFAAFAGVPLMLGVKLRSSPEPNRS